MNKITKRRYRSTGLWSSSDDDDDNTPKSKTLLSTGLWSSNDRPKSKTLLSTGLWSSSSDEEQSCSDRDSSNPILKSPTDTTPCSKKTSINKAEMMPPEQEEGELSPSEWSGEYVVKDEASLSPSEYGYFTAKAPKRRKCCEESNGAAAAAATWKERDCIVVASSDYGFTVTNGADSFSHNGIDATWALLLRYVIFALCEAMPDSSVIYVTDAKTYFRVERSIKNVIQNLDKRITTEIVDRDISFCPICQYAECHVWTANRVMDKIVRPATSSGHTKKTEMGFRF